MLEMKWDLNLEWDPVSSGMTSGGVLDTDIRSFFSCALIKDSHTGPSHCRWLTASRKQEGF